MRTQVRSPEPMSSPGVMVCFCYPGTGEVKRKDPWDLWPVSSKLGERPVSEIKVEDNWRKIPLTYLHTHHIQMISYVPEPYFLGKTLESFKSTSLKLILLLEK